MNNNDTNPVSGQTGEEAETQAQSQNRAQSYTQNQNQNQNRNFHQNFNSRQTKNNTQGQGNAQKQGNPAGQQPSWMQHPNLQGMDPAKLQMLQSIASQGSQKGMNDLLPFLMSSVTQNQSNGLHFSSQEMDSIIEVLKVGKSQEEVNRMNRMLQIVKMMR